MPMNEILDLLPIPAERDFPPGRKEARRRALVATLGIVQGERRSFAGTARRVRGLLARSWLTLIGLVVLVCGLVAVSLGGRSGRLAAGPELVLSAAAAAPIVAAVSAPAALRSRERSDGLRRSAATPAIGSGVMASA